MIQREIGLKAGTGLQSADASRDDLVVKHLGLAHTIASRYAHRGEQVADLRQAGMIGLLKAADRFDRQRGDAFTAYAYAKILGEIRRYFRDKCWTIRVPRKMQELRSAVESVRNTISATLGRNARNAEVAARLCVSEKEVLRAGDLSSAYRPLSLDAPIDSGGKPLSLLEGLGYADPGIEKAEIRRDVAIACATLSEHERVVVRLRFFEALPQRTIGKLFGKSQMYVSRLEKTAIKKLRCGYYGCAAGTHKLGCAATRRAASA